MKLTISEWSKILTVLNDKAESLKGSLKYYEEDTETAAEYRKELDDTLRIMKKISEFAV